MWDEKTVIARAKSGDTAAFEQLVTQYEKKIYTLAMSYCGNEQDALDVSQEVFLRVYRFLPGFNEESRFSTWLYRITVNACKDTLRKRSIRFELSLDAQQDDDFALDVPDLRFNPEHELERLELLESLRQGLLALSPDHREILIMRDVAGMTYSEISRALTLESGTVKSRIARARDNLRAFLCKQGNNSPSVQSNQQKGGSSGA